MLIVSSQRDNHIADCEECDHKLHNLPSTACLQPVDIQLLSLTLDRGCARSGVKGPLMWGSSSDRLISIV